MSKLHINVDVDGVLAALVEHLIEKLAFCGKHRTLADFKHHDFAKVLNEAELKIVHDTMNRPGFCYEVPWHDGALDFVKTLAAEHDVLIVTSPWWSPTWQHERREWLRPAGLERRVCGVPTPYKKHFHGDVLVEDHAGTLFDWCTAHPNGMGILIDKPWNQPTSNEYKFHKHVIRVHSYDQALDYIRQRATGVLPYVLAA